jgi:hypothetical protein
MMRRSDTSGKLKGAIKANIRPCTTKYKRREEEGIVVIPARPGRVGSSGRAGSSRPP